MKTALTKTYLAAQLAGAVLVITFVAASSLRCIASGNIFCAVGFALIAYGAGYRCLLRTAITEFKANKKRI